MADKMCPDCGGFDIEWMYKCFTHNVEYCRGCECPDCAEDDGDEWDVYEEDGPMDLEDQLEAALNRATGS